MDPTLNGEVMFFLQTVKEQLTEHFQGLFLYCKENVGHLIWNLLVIFFIFFAATGSPPFRCFDKRNYFSAALSAVSGQTHL